VNEKEANHPAHPMDRTANWCSHGGWFTLAIGKWAFQFFSPSGVAGILPYVLSIIGKEIKINFLPVLYTRTPSEEALTPKNTHWPKPGQAYFRQNASIGCHYPTLTCDIKVNRKVRKRRYWNTPCFTTQRAHRPMLWPLVARPWDRPLVSICTWYIYALDKPASILVRSYRNTLCLFFNY
jgi:hypothetical protein